MPFIMAFIIIYYNITYYKMADTYDNAKFNYAKNNYSFDKMQTDLENSQKMNSFYVRQLVEIRDNGVPVIPQKLVNNANKSMSNNVLFHKLDESKRESTTIDVLNNDNYELIMNQNTMYITGTLACASLIIGAILLSQK